MAHKKAALKHIRQTKKRTEHNLGVKKNIIYLRRQVMKFVTLKDKAQASDFFLKLTKAVDKAAARDILKKNSAARRKSRLAAKINAL